MKIQKVLIVGGGISGMSAAIALGKRDVEVDIAELREEWGAYGAGISITNPTLRALHALGVYESVCEQGATTSSLRMHAADGRMLKEVQMPPTLNGIATGAGVMRPVLHSILAKATRASGARVRLGTTVESYQDDGRGVTVRFSDGSTGRYDLMIGADGLFSTIRTMLFPDAPKPLFTGQACWRMVAQRLPGVDGTEIYLNASSIAGLNPVSHEEMYLFLLDVVKHDWRPTAQELFDSLATRLDAYGGKIAQVRRAMNDQSVIVFRPLECILVPAPWYRGRVVLIGDAVHGTTPQLASGAGMSIEDALVLDECLAEGDSIPAALERFVLRRFPRCELVVKNSVAIGEIEMGRGNPQDHMRLMDEANAALAAPY